MERKKRILIVCCNRLLRESIAKILTKRTDFEIASAAGLGPAALDEAGACGADVLVLDSLELLPQNRKSSPGCSGVGSGRCVLVAMEDDHSRFLTAIRRGARGYVLQDATAVEVVSAIRTVAEGAAVCPPRYAQVLFDFVAAQSSELPSGRKRAQWGLTCREQQLIPLIGQGLSNKEIGTHLNLSEQTIKNHVHRILRKVGAPDRLSVFEICQNPISDPRTGPTGYSTKVRAAAGNQDS